MTEPLAWLLLIALIILVPACFVGIFFLLLRAADRTKKHIEATHDSPPPREPDSRLPPVAESPPQDPEALPEPPPARDRDSSSEVIHAKLGCYSRFVGSHPSGAAGTTYIYEYRMQPITIPRPQAGQQRLTMRCQFCAKDVPLLVRSRQCRRVNFVAGAFVAVPLVIGLLVAWWDDVTGRIAAVFIGLMPLPLADHFSTPLSITQGGSPPKPHILKTPDDKNF